MEESESENLFDALNINPQLFINEVLNTVDDLVDQGFDFFQQQAVESLGFTSEEEHDRLRKGVSYIHNMIQEALDKRLDVWEKYCLRHCFTVPEGLSLPKADTPGDCSMEHVPLTDPELDNELDSLREKLAAAANESGKLERELRAMRKQSITNSHVESIMESLKLFDQKSLRDMFQEMGKAAVELRAQIEKLEKKRMAEMELERKEKIFNSNKDQILVHQITGLSDDDLRCLQELAKS